MNREAKLVAAKVWDEDKDYLYPLESDGNPKGYVGTCFRKGSTPTTSTNRKTSKFPVQYHSYMRGETWTHNTHINKWYIKNALAEATRNNNEYRMRQFGNMSGKNFPQGDLDTCESYLWNGE